MIKACHLTKNSATALPFKLINIVLPLLFPALLILQSCERAPATGEAFITLKSDEVRHLGDKEIMFYGSEFLLKFEDFKRNLANEKQEKIKFLHNQRLSEVNQRLSTADKELLSFETMRDSLLVDARKVAIKKFEQEKAAAAKKSEQEKAAAAKKSEQEKAAVEAEIKSLQSEISAHATIVDKIERKFCRFFDEEKALSIKAAEIRAKANKLSEELINKINAVIVAEQIAAPKLPLNANGLKISIYSINVNEAQPEPRTLIRMISDPDFLHPIDNFNELFGISQWLADVDRDRRIIEMGPSLEFIVSAEPRLNSYDPVMTIAARNIPKNLENYKIASEIRNVLKTLLSFESKLEQLEVEVCNNNKTLKQTLQVFANTENLTPDSIGEILKRQSELLEKIEQSKTILLKFDGVIISPIITTDELAVMPEETFVAEQLKITRAEFDNRVARLQQKLFEIKTEAENLSNLHDFSMSDFSQEIEAADQTKIASFLVSQQISSTRTSSDGKFAVPPQARYASAFLKRDATAEEIFWLVKINLKDTSLKLSNSNITKTSRTGALMGALDAKLE